MKRYLRKATLQDKKLIYNWANDPDTRKNSFNQETIKWEDHEAWYDKRMADDNTKMYIFMDFFMAIGQVRLDVEDDLKSPLADILSELGCKLSDSLD